MDLSLARCGLLGALLTVAAVTGGCQPAPTQDIAELGRLGARITVAPERADEILREAGVAPAEFAAAVRDLASRPAASRRYREAFAAESEALAPAPRARRSVSRLGP